MTALYIVGGIIAFFALIAFVPVGAEARYDGLTFSFSARVWVVKIVLGGAKKGKTPKKENKKKDAGSGSAQKKKKKKLPPFAVLKMLAGNGFSMLGRIVSRFYVDELKIHFISAFDDPADAAMAYAAAGMAMEALTEMGGKRLRHTDLRAGVDFDAREPVIDLYIRLSIRVGALLRAALRFGAGFLKDFLAYRSNERKSEHGKQSNR